MNNNTVNFYKDVADQALKQDLPVKGSGVIIGQGMMTTHGVAHTSAIILLISGCLMEVPISHIEVTGEIDDLDEWLEEVQADAKKAKALVAMLETELAEAREAAKQIKLDVAKAAQVAGEERDAVIAELTPKMHEAQGAVSDAKSAFDKAKVELAKDEELDEEYFEAVEEATEALNDIKAEIGAATASDEAVDALTDANDAATEVQAEITRLSAELVAARKSL